MEEKIRLRYHLWFFLLFYILFTLNFKSISTEMSHIKFGKYL